MLCFELGKYIVVSIAHTFFDFVVKVSPVGARALSGTFTCGNGIPCTGLKHSAFGDCGWQIAVGVDGVLGAISDVLLVRTITNGPMYAWDCPNKVN